MAELRRDPIVGRWVIMDTEHPAAPEEYEYEPHIPKGGDCPFCYGNESLTPSEIESFRKPGTGANTTGWQVRVVPNKFPALQIEGNLNKQGIGIYDMSNGIGAHEVLVESPYHHKDIPDLTSEEVEKIIEMYIRRTVDLEKDKRFKYIMVFRNFGRAAGASLEHPHSQIIALPMVPKNVKEELVGAENYLEYRERCIFCDIVKQESHEKERIIMEDKNFLAFFPFVSRFPFETWIIPKRHDGCFCTLSKEEIRHFAFILKNTLAKIKKIFPDLSYNYIIHISPCNSDKETESYHWHLELMPKLTRVAGFEWGTGFYLVPTPPEIAAEYLRNTDNQSNL